MRDHTLRRLDLAAGRRGDRIVIGRAAAGAAPLFLDVAEARWLALVALPALNLTPEPEPPTMEARRPTLTAAPALI